jgi:hypothetical protein
MYYIKFIGKQQRLKKMCKTLTVFKEIIEPYNKTFGTAEIKEAVMNHPNIFNIEHLVELTMAKVGGYEFTDDEHCDFSDGSECKTGSVSPNPVKAGTSSYRLEISNVVSSGGKMKSGDLRVIIYNPHTNSCCYYFIPNDKIKSCGINYHPTTGIGRIFATWNIKTNRIPKLDKFQVNGFEELAKLQN